MNPHTPSPDSPPLEPEAKPNVVFGSSAHVMRAFPNISPTSTCTQYVSMLGKSYRSFSDSIKWCEAGSSPCAVRTRIQILRGLIKDSETRPNSVSEVPTAFCNLLTVGGGSTELEKRLTEVNLEIRKGVNTRAKSDEDLGLEVKKAIEYAQSPGLIVTPLNVFGCFLPPRRPSDLECFFIVDEEGDWKENVNRNLYVRSTKTLIFNKYKNSHIHGEQRFRIDDPLLAEVSFRGENGINAAVSFFENTEKYPNGSATPLLSSPGSLSSLTRCRGGLSNNAFRHAIESRLSHRGSRGARLFALRFLAHSAHTSLHFYTFDSNPE